MVDYDDYNIKDHISYLNFEFKSPPEFKACVYRDWGVFYKRRNYPKKAVEDFRESLANNAEGYQAMVELSRCQLQLGDADTALASVEACLAQYPTRSEAQIQRNICIYEQNRFEEALRSYATSYQQFPRVPALKTDGQMVRLTIEGTIDHHYVGACLLRMRKDIAAYDEYRQAQAAITDLDRPLWKQLRDRGECDVVSILVRPPPYIPLIKQLRTERKLRNMGVMYFGMHTADDIDFLRRLRSDRRLFLKHTVHSNEVCADAINTGLKGVSVMERRLWSRRPVYAARYSKQPEAQRAMVEAGLNRIQYATRRLVFQQMRIIRRHIALGEPQKACDLVDDVVARCYATKTRRVFPRKFEFTNEIINEIGLLYLRNEVYVPRLDTPDDLMQLPVALRLAALMRAPPAKTAGEKVSALVAEFGDRSAFVDPEAPDVGYHRYKKKTNYLEKRMQHSRVPIESCFMAFQLATLHIAERKFDETRAQATKLVQSAQQCKNRVWELIGLLLGARIDIVSSSFVLAGQKIEAMKTIAPVFDDCTKHFIDTACLVHKQHMAQYVK